MGNLDHSRNQVLFSDPNLLPEVRKFFGLAEQQPTERSTAAENPSGLRPYNPFDDDLEVFRKRLAEESPAESQDKGKKQEQAMAREGQKPCEGQEDVNR